MTNTCLPKQSRIANTNTICQIQFCQFAESPPPAHHTLSTSAPLPPGIFLLIERCFMSGLFGWLCSWENCKVFKRLSELCFQYILTWHCVQNEWQAITWFAILLWIYNVPGCGLIGKYFVAYCWLHSALFHGCLLADLLFCHFL